MPRNMLYLTNSERKQLAQCGGKCGGCAHAGDCDLMDRLDEPDNTDRSLGHDEENVKRYGLKPAEYQAIIWVKIRGLKTANKDMFDGVDYVSE